MLNSGKIDACMEVCQHFVYYFPGSAITSQMTWPQRAVNTLYALRDHSPLATSLALMILPIALFPTHPDGFAAALSEYHDDLFWLRVSFIITFIAQKTNKTVMYRHIGLSKVANFRSHEIWAAPCKASP